MKKKVYLREWITRDGTTILSIVDNTIEYDRENLLDDFTISIRYFELKEELSK